MSLLYLNNASNIFKLIHLYIFPIVFIPRISLATLACQFRRTVSFITANPYTRYWNAASGMHDTNLSYLTTELYDNWSIAVSLCSEYFLSIWLHCGDSDQIIVFIMLWSIKQSDGTEDDTQATIELLALSDEGNSGSMRRDDYHVLPLIYSVNMLANKR